MSARTPEQQAEDREATKLATSLYRVVCATGLPPIVTVNAAAGLLGALVAQHAPRGEEDYVMREMATQAREMMERQLQQLAIGEPVGRA